MRTYGVGMVFEAGDPMSPGGAIDRFLGLGETELRTISSNWEKFRREFSPNSWLENCRELYDVVRKANL